MLAIIQGHKANPDEKGTERDLQADEGDIAALVTKPIPMKRELKVSSVSSLPPGFDPSHKANPDEKGTESREGRRDRGNGYRSHKANPDEKGTERIKKF